MIDRYSRPEMASIWSIKNKYEKWLQIEIAVCEALAEKGEIPKSALENIKSNAKFDPSRIDEIEKTVKHDVIAFLTNVAEHVGEDSRYIHMGMTSSDLLDTALAIQLKEASAIILKDLNVLSDVLKKRAYEFKDTVMIGRSHGIHAEPVTFGLKLALWYSENQRNIKRMEHAKETISYGMVSGAVGTFANIDPSVEEYVCNKFSLKPAPVSNQIIQRDRHAEYLTTLSLIASSIEKISVELRHLQRTEVLEAEEYFSMGQKGSSAMPHKRNPITAEQLAGLSRVVRANAIAAMENVALWHERDISHSSVERIIIPDSTILIDYMLNKAANLIDKLLVYPENMKKNLDKMGGVIYSESILLELVRSGIAREAAYKLVQRVAMKIWERGGDFKELILNDREIMKYITPASIEKAFSINHHLKNVSYIFKRVFKS
ncbi:MAG TPA: adenylosuccinate lyase [Nitrospinae bacterium]|nr:adenylosuccinate lyase [Nitrospinota bacterium]HBA27647.1 adenylosuccinate lyase [Nitrospinota bacterium]